MGIKTRVSPRTGKVADIRNVKRIKILGAPPKRNFFSEKRDHKVRNAFFLGKDLNGQSVTGSPILPLNTLLPRVDVQHQKPLVPHIHG